MSKFYILDYDTIFDEAKAKWAEEPAATYSKFTTNNGTELTDDETLGDNGSDAVTRLIFHGRLFGYGDGGFGTNGTVNAVNRFIYAGLETNVPSWVTSSYDISGRSFVFYISDGTRRNAVVLNNDNNDIMKIYDDNYDFRIKGTSQGNYATSMHIVRKNSAAFTYDTTTIENQGSDAGKRWGFSGLKLFVKSRSDNDYQVEELFITANNNIIAKITPDGLHNFAIKEPATDVPWSEITASTFYDGVYGSTPYGISKRITMSENSTYTFTTDDISGNQKDGNAVTKIKITELPRIGKLQLSGNDITLNQEIDTSDITNITYVSSKGDFVYRSSNLGSFRYSAYDGSNYSRIVSTINMLPSTSGEFKIEHEITDVSSAEFIGNYKAPYISLALSENYVVVGGHNNPEVTDLDVSQNSGILNVRKITNGELGEPTRLYRTDAPQNAYIGTVVAMNDDHIVAVQGNNGNIHTWKRTGDNVWAYNQTITPDETVMYLRNANGIQMYNEYVIMQGKDGAVAIKRDNSDVWSVVFKTRSKDTSGDPGSDSSVELKYGDSSVFNQGMYGVSMSDNYIAVHDSNWKLGNHNKTGRVRLFKKGVDGSGNDTWTYTQSLYPIVNGSGIHGGDITNSLGFGAHVHLDGDNTILCVDPRQSYEPAVHGGNVQIYKRSEDENGDDIWTHFQTVFAEDVWVDIQNTIARMGAPGFTAYNNYMILSRLQGNGYIGKALRAFKKNSLGYYVQISNPVKNSGSAFEHSKDLRLLGDRLVTSSMDTIPKLVVWDLSGDSNEKNPNKPVGVSKTITIAQDSTYTFTANDISGSDADGHAIGKFKITQLPTKGTLKLSGSDVTSNQDIPVGDVTNLTYTPANSEYGNTYTTILYKPHDGSDYAENHANITFNVTQDENQAEAESSGIASNKIDVIKNATISQNGAETTVFASKFIKNVSQRHSAIKLLFSKNTSITKTKIKRKDLKLTPNIKKEKVMVHKPKTTATVAAASALVVNDEVDADTGIYANLADVGDAIKFKAHSGATDVVFTKTSGGYTASTSGDTVWQPGDRYTFENVSYYFD